MDTFSYRLDSFFSEFGDGRKMVLSTTDNNKVSSRMMSVVQIDGEFYFQTGLSLKKYRQISVNKNVALCIDNIQIEGVCSEIGHPLENTVFCEVFKKCFKGSYDAYTSLKNERLFVIKPMYIERWIYKEGIPFIEAFDFKAHKYSLNEYIGI